LAAAALSPAARADTGSFTSSDPLLNAIWQALVSTAGDMIAAGPIVTDSAGRSCAIDTKLVVLDGAVRDCCPYVGDLAVEGKTLLISNPAALPALRAMLLWFAANQHGDGAIPASPYDGGSAVLFDYNAYWIEDVYDYVLYTGDLGLLQQVWPNLVALIDTWYAAHVGPSGLLVNDLGPSDYAGFRRRGSTIAYYNAGYVRALRMAVQLANWTGDKSDAADWQSRITPVAAAFSKAFWDDKVGAFRDAPDGPVVHPQDGNVFAILAGLATPAQATSALDYLSQTTQRPWGDTIADNNVWDDPVFGDSTGERPYPFMSYFDVVARYQAGRAASGLELIRREWGYMLHNGPRSTMWESIGPDGGPPQSNYGPSWDHGWSSGAAPALTQFVLGVTPASPGFASFNAMPYPGVLAWARGDVPTPQGTIHFEWSRNGQKFTAKVVSPVPGTVTLPGHKPVSVPAGTHVIG
jgi:hypothetical protein